MAKAYQDKQFLYDRYILKKQTIDQIAQELNDQGVSVTSMTVYNWIKKFGLIKNPRNLGARAIGGKRKGYYD